MDRQEQVCTQPAGNTGTLGQQQVTIIVSGKRDAHPALRQKFIAQSLRQRERQHFFLYPPLTRPGVVAAMSGVDDHQRPAGVWRTIHFRQPDFGGCCR